MSTNNSAPGFLALGDSYTIGEAVDPAEAWPPQLAARLQRDGIAIAEPQIIARTGWTTDELDRAITAARPSGRFGLVTLLIGVNNEFRRRPLEEYRIQFSALLARAVGFAGGDASHVIVVSIPDWGVTPFGLASGRDPAAIGQEIDAFNAAAAAEAARVGAHFVDITPESRRAASDPSLVAADGLHPSARMYSEWTDLIEPVAREALTPR